MSRSALVALILLGCTVGDPDEMPDFSGDADGEENETFDASSDATGGEADSSTGDGDGSAGDGDGSTGDGDGASGDGDGSAGDGDGSAGDGDGSMGDGDGSTGDGDGSTGDGDGTTGDGDGTYAHTIVIDGVNDFTTDETFTTSTPSHTAYVAWDASYVYFGFDGPDVGGGNGQVFWFAYLGAGGSATTMGELYGTQQPALAFSADHHLRWKADDSFSDGMNWTGAQWQSINAFFTPGDVFRAGDFVELRVARSLLGDPAQLDVHLGMLNEAAGGEWTWGAVPSTSYVDGVDPDFGTYYRFDLSGSVEPAGHSPN
jgi:hypothetical protein